MFNRHRLTETAESFKHSTKRKVPQIVPDQAELDTRAPYWHDSTRMKENQNTEWKESWRDEYLKWLCGFANAQGGVLVVGRNDRGVAVGLSDSKKLLEDLPNKIRDVLGIMADV